MTTPTPLLNDIRPPGNSYVLPDHKMVYMSVTKVACTSLRWMVADLAGEDLEAFYSASGGHQTRLMTIHTARSKWQHTPQLGSLSAEQLAEISRDNGWFIFAVVRDPWSRLWSAWQSKFLVRANYYVDRYVGEPWFPRIPEKPSDVVEDFRSFVEAAPWVSHPELSTDPHFLPQTHSVKPRHINYSKIYDLSDMSSLFTDIRAHLETVGRSQELYLPRANETPLAMTAEVLEGGIDDAIERLYADDFEAFGERWDRASLKLAPDGWTDDAIKNVQYHTVANQRIGDMRDAVHRLQRQLRRARSRLGQVEESPSFWRRVKRRIRG